MKRFIKIVAVLILIASAILCCSGCSEAERVDYNISKQATYFECERRVTVYNARTDKIILYIEGYINIENNSYDELVITAKVSENTYKKNYVYLNDYTLYVVEDINGTHTDSYHYKVYFDMKTPDINIK